MGMGMGIEVGVGEMGQGWVCEVRMEMNSV